MRDNIFQQNIHPKSHKSMIVSKSEGSYWAYFLDAHKKIIADCWLTNDDSHSLKTLDYYQKKGVPSPLKKEHIKKNIAPLLLEKIGFRWSPDGETGIIQYERDDLIVFKPNEKLGYSRNIQGECPWGKEWKI